MSDIRTAIKTVRDTLVFGKGYDAALAALSTIEAELGRLRAQEAQDRRTVNRVCAERDEAVAALRECFHMPDGASWDSHRYPSYAEGGCAVCATLTRLSTPKEG